MSYFADVKCPKCKKIKQLHLGVLMFYGHNKEYCSFCGFEFDPKTNCINIEEDKEE